MSETRGLRSPYGRNREVRRAGGVGWPDIAISYPNFPTGSSYFTSEMIAPKGTVFVTDHTFEIYRCQGVPYAVRQGGKLFPEGTSVSSPCHRKKLLRRAYFVQDIRNNKRYDDISFLRSKAVLAEIAKSTKCNTSGP